MLLRQVCLGVPCILMVNLLVSHLFHDVSADVLAFLRAVSGAGPSTEVPCLFIVCRWATFVVWMHSGGCLGVFSCDRFVLRYSCVRSCLISVIG